MKVEYIFSLQSAENHQVSVSIHRVKIATSQSQAELTTVFIPSHIADITAFNQFQNKDHRADMFLKKPSKSPVINCQARPIDNQIAVNIPSRTIFIPFHTNSQAFFNHPHTASRLDFIPSHTAISFGFIESQFFHTSYIATHKATITAITARTGAVISQKTAQIAPNAVQIGHIINHSATSAVVNHNIAPVTIIIFLDKTGF